MADKKSIFSSISPGGGGEETSRPAPQDLSALKQKLDAIEKALARNPGLDKLSDRMEALENAMGKLDSLEQNLAWIAGKLEEVASKEPDLSLLTEVEQNLKASMTEGSAKKSAKLSELAKKIGEIEDFMGELASKLLEKEKNEELKKSKTEAILRDMKAIAEKLARLESAAALGAKNEKESREALVQALGAVKEGLAVLHGGLSAAEAENSAVKAALKDIASVLTPEQLESAMAEAGRAQEKKLEALGERMRDLYAETELREADRVKALENKLEKIALNEKEKKDEFFKTLSSELNNALKLHFERYFLNFEREQEKRISALAAELRTEKESFSRELADEASGHEKRTAKAITESVEARNAELLSRIEADNARAVESMKNMLLSVTNSDACSKESAFYAEALYKLHLGVIETVRKILSDYEKVKFSEISGVRASVLKRNYVELGVMYDNFLKTSKEFEELRKKLEESLKGR